MMSRLKMHPKKVKNPNNGSDVWHLQRNVRADDSHWVHQVYWTSDAGNDISKGGCISGFDRRWTRN